MPILSELMYWLSQAAVASMAAAAVIEAGRKRFDLFGMLVVAVSAALGGGSLRDMLLDRPVFWVRDQTYLLTALGAALLMFFIARRWRMPLRMFLISDALGLALFTVVGTRVALNMDAAWLTASFLGVVTGVMGGILRDILCNEEPLVFQGPLYATAAWAGALFYIVLIDQGLSGVVPALLAGSLVFGLRVAALRWIWRLPSYRDADDARD
ncbi:MAG: trimeric intracellular cation channel family protein [Oceanococcus sp.]|nr:MAG: trimeric intracellular cation channel family protein [Oceanococcus sp.]